MRVDPEWAMEPTVRLELTILRNPLAVLSLSSAFPWRAFSSILRVSPRHPAQHGSSGFPALLQALEFYVFAVEVKHQGLCGCGSGGFECALVGGCGGVEVIQALGQEFLSPIGAFLDNEVAVLYGNGADFVGGGGVAAGEAGELAGRGGDLLVMRS